MKLLFDQNISPRILKYLAPTFVGSQQVRFVGLEDASDLEIFDLAKLHGYALVTFDSDFIDLNAVKGTPPKVIWLNTGNMTTKNLVQLLNKYSTFIKAYTENETDEILEIKNAP